MKLIDSLIIALKALGGNKLRSFLTMLGVIIGIFAVITLVSMGEAGKAFIYFQISQFGTGSTYMEIHPGKPGSAGSRFTGALESTLTREDVNAIAKLKHVKAVIGSIVRSGTLKYGHKAFDTSFLEGTSYNYVEMVTHRVEKGRFFTSQEEALRKKVCVIGPTVAKELFGNFLPIGERIKVNGSKFVVIGVLEKKGSMFGFDLDSMAFIPLATAENLFDTKRIIEIGVTAIDDASVPSAVAEIRQALISRHGEEDFRIETQTQTLDTINSVMSVLTSMIGGIAAISLLVGGIGIMNIMLVSVTERTREIGIRKAIGATKRDVFIQFLVESVVISLLGGVIGIALGVGVSLVIMKFIGVPLIIATWAATLAVFVSLGVGIGSGLYPSMRAASLDPVEALRYE